MVSLILVLFGLIVLGCILLRWLKVEIINEEVKKYNEELTVQNAQIQEHNNILVAENNKLNNRKEDLLKAIENYTQQYQIILEDRSQDYLKFNDKIEEIKKQLEGYQSIARAAISENQKQRQEKEQKEYFRIQISDIDIQEIKKIREIEPYLRDATPLQKVIWKCYYETPTGEMIGRVVGPKEKTGIYKITNLNNGMIYIGQAKAISKRFKEHIKKGIGAEATSKNRLYSAMLKEGVENFMFEVLEECPVDELDFHEAYWINYFQTNLSGYHMTAGNNKGENK